MIGGGWSILCCPLSGVTKRFTCNTQQDVPLPRDPGWRRFLRCKVICSLNLGPGGCNPKKPKSTAANL